MSNNNAEYWANRFAMLKDAQYKKADEYVKELGKVYRQIRSDLEKDLAKWYNRLAENNEVSLAEAKRMLDNEELEEFKWTVEQYIERASDAGLARKYMKELENASARVHIRRLEAMELQIEYYVALLMNSEEKGINELLSGLYSDTYYQAIYEIQKGSGIGAEFTALNTQTIENVMLKPWADDGLSFGKRIREKYSPEFVSRLSKTLSRSLISGDSQRKLARSLEKDFDLAEGQAERLIQTESAFFIEAATLKSYEETGVDEYKILATLDYKTSEICRSMDGKVFSRKDAVIGVNCPPFHCRCRTTTVPLTGYEDMFEPGERVARNADGKIYYVPEDMTYPEWYKKYVESDPEEALKVKKLKNRRADEKQYKRYKERLGKENVPETLELFQEKKYNRENDETFSFMELDYKRRGRLIDNPELALPNAEKATADERKFTKYLFGGTNKNGLAKGRAFKSRLGYDIDNFEELRQKILEAATKYPATKNGVGEWGVRYEQKIVLYGRKGTPANVIVGWCTKDDATWLTSVYIKEIDR